MPTTAPNPTGYWLAGFVSCLVLLWLVVFCIIIRSMMHSDDTVPGGFPVIGDDHGPVRKR
jgi:hypothetical protein